MLILVPLVPLCPVACPVVFHRRNVLFMRIPGVFGALSRLSRPPVYIRARKKYFVVFYFLFFCIYKYIGGKSRDIRDMNFLKP